MLRGRLHRHNGGYRLKAAVQAVEQMGRSVWTA